MFPDRKMQLKILEELKSYYPESIRVAELQSTLNLQNNPDFNANLFYLHDHALVEGHESEESGDRYFLLMQITVDGIDHLADDGGLKAILSRVHIKFDEDDLAKLLSAKIETSNVPPEVKRTLMNTIKTLPAEGIKTVYTHLLNLGLKHVQDVPQLIGSIQDNLP